MAENKIELKSVSELGNKKFIVPNYQRGYKWRAKDVEYLIDDIAEIKEDDNSDYCLQPIVVAKDNDKYVLVDGQQRLTTIWLIINWAKHNGFEIDWNYCIEYQTRDQSNTFLKDIQEILFQILKKIIFKKMVLPKIKGLATLIIFRKHLKQYKVKAINLRRFSKILKRTSKSFGMKLTQKKAPLILND